MTKMEVVNDVRLRIERKVVIKSGA